jgi:Flp pilus assembly protein TadD
VSLIYGDQLPLETLLSGNYGRLNDELRESVYAKGWLLTHYLNFDQTRRPQLAKYVQEIAAGKGGLEAARSAFGDLHKLENELRDYVKQRRISALRIQPRSPTPPTVEVTALSPGAATVLPLRIDSKMGVDNQTAEPLAAKVRKVEAKYPGDPLVEVTLAEAEIDSGHPEASEAAADRALSADPRNTEAMIFKARSIIERGMATKTPDPKRFAQGRDWLLKANKIDSEDPEPLVEYYKSYLFEGLPPTKNAIDALHYASNLAPQDPELRLNSAMQYVRDKDLKEARSTLAPIAFNPHDSGMADAARKVIARIDAGDAAGALKVTEAESSEPAPSKGSN